VTPPAPSFDADIKPLFREFDRSAMTFMFDLWDHADVKANVSAILAAVQGGDMPCDDTWPPEWIELFRRWIEGGCPP
jgi:hypothetical protein